MDTRDNLQRAIAAARAGRELVAREIFLDIVKAEPHNETAWLWLTGLLDNPADRIYACKKVLEINPENARIQEYLTSLLAERQKAQDPEKLRAAQKLEHALALVKANKNDDALHILHTLTEANTVSPDVWRALAQVAPEVEEQIHALNQLLKLTPDDAQARNQLQQLENDLRNPLGVAALYEEQGELEKALAAYKRAALLPGTKDQWDAIYWKISRLENLRKEDITYISPKISIARLTFGPVVLYLTLMLAQIGINPFAHPEPLLWLGFLWVLFGGFVIALTSVHSSKRLESILSKSFGAQGITVARFALAIGWMFVLLPYLFLFVVAFLRLADVLFS